MDALKEQDKIFLFLSFRDALTGLNLLMDVPFPGPRPGIEETASLFRALNERYNLPIYKTCSGDKLFLPCDAFFSQKI